MQLRILNEYCELINMVLLYHNIRYFSILYNGRHRDNIKKCEITETVGGLPSTIIMDMYLYLIMYLYLERLAVIYNFGLK